MRMTLWLAIGVVVLVIVWLAAGRHIAMALDRITTGPSASLPVDPFVYSGGGFDIGGKTMTFADTKNLRDENLDARLDPSGRVVLTTGHETFVMGPLTVPSPNGRPPYRFQPDPGDQLSFTAAKSLLPWPTPFEFKWLGGSSPWWRQYVYYRLNWKKPSGARLKMQWRFERQYYSGKGWTDPDTTWMNDQTGLLPIEISGQ